MRHEGGTEILLSLLIAICDREKSKKITDFFRDRGASFNLLTLGRGTASSKILNYLGLGQTEKTILFGAMPPGEAEDVLDRLDETLDLKRPGHGIAFILPLCALVSALGGERAVRETDEKEENESIRDDSRQDGGSDVAQNFRHTLIIAVSNRGYSQEVMDAARTAQAAGGTIINARVFAPSGAEKFFGVTIQPEKEIVMILAGAHQKNDIMRAIAERTGTGTSADAMAFSMPVTDVRGLQSPLPQREEYRKI
jgi:nitrogen regulatory protein PII